MLSKNVIQATKGKFFTVTFIKKDNSKRIMIARIGVKRGLTGAGRTWERENLVTVWDVKSKGYRNINLETVTAFKCGNVKFGI